MLQHWPHCSDLPWGDYPFHGWCVATPLAVHSSRPLGERIETRVIPQRVPCLPSIRAHLPPMQQRECCSGSDPIHPFSSHPPQKHVPPLSPIFSPLFTPPHLSSPPPPATPYNIIQQPPGCGGRGLGAHVRGIVAGEQGAPAPMAQPRSVGNGLSFGIQRVTQTNTNRTQNCGIHVLPYCKPLR